MKGLFLDLARTVVEFRPGYHNEIGSYLRSKGYCVSDREVFREIARQRAWLHLSQSGRDVTSLDFISLASMLTGELPDEEIVTEMSEISVPAQTCSIYSDIPPFLEKARARGLKTILIANTADSRNGLMDGLSLEELFDGTVYAPTAGIRRSGNGVFRAAEELAGGSGLFIGDTFEVDSADAANAGIPYVLLDREGYYSDIRRNKAKTLNDCLSYVNNSYAGDSTASVGGDEDFYPSLIYTFADWKPQVVGRRGSAHQRRIWLEHETSITDLTRRVHLAK